MLLTLISLPDGWEFSEMGLVQLFVKRDASGKIISRSEGRESVRASLRTLEEQGYLRREQRKGEIGSYGCADYYIYEEPRQASDNSAKPQSASKLPSAGRYKNHKPFYSPNSSVEKKATFSQKNKNHNELATEERLLQQVSLLEKIKFIKNKLEEEWPGWWRVAIENPLFSEEQKNEKRVVYERVIDYLAMAFEYEQLHKVSVEVFVGFVAKVKYIDGATSTSAYVRALLPELLEKAIKEKERREGTTTQSQHYYFQGVVTGPACFKFEIKNPDVAGIEIERLKKTFRQCLQDHVSAVTYDISLKDAGIEITAHGINLVFDNENSIQIAERYKENIESALGAALKVVTEMSSQSIA